MGPVVPVAWTRRAVNMYIVSWLWQPVHTSLGSLFHPCNPGPACHQSRGKVFGAVETARRDGRGLGGTCQEAVVQLHHMVEW